MASFHASIKENQPITLKQVTGVATSLGAKRVCDQAFNVSKTNKVKSIIVSD